MRGLQGKVLALIATCAAAGVAGCGSSSQLPEASGSPLTTGTVGFSQTGNADAHIQKSSVTYRIDASGSLVVQLSLASSAAATQTISVRATLYNNLGSIIDDAVGGQVQVTPGGTAQVELTGPPPQGTIASAVFEVSATSAPTPLKNTPIPGGTPG